MNKKHEKLGRLVEQYNLPEVMRRQTVALRDYLRWAKTNALPADKTKGEVAVELYLANEAAITCLHKLLGVSTESMKS